MRQEYAIFMMMKFDEFDFDELCHRLSPSCRLLPVALILPHNIDTTSRVGGGKPSEVDTIWYSLS